MNLEMEHTQFLLMVKAYMEKLKEEPADKKINGMAAEYPDKLFVLHRYMMAQGWRGKKLRVHDQDGRFKFDFEK